MDNPTVRLNFAYPPPETFINGDLSINRELEVQFECLYSNENQLDQFLSSLPIINTLITTALEKGIAPFEKPNYFYRVHVETPGREEEKEVKDRLTIFVRRYEGQRSVPLDNEHLKATLEFTRLTMKEWQRAFSKEG